MLAACQELRSRELRNGVDLGSRMELCRSRLGIKVERERAEQERDREMWGLEVRRRGMGVKS